jgi:hypothetical protein
VDTSTLKVDSANNRVGIGTASPSAPLHILAPGTDTAAIRLAATGGRVFDIGSTAASYGSANNLVIYDITGGAERWRLDSAGVHTWNNVGGVAGTAMTLNSTGLGVGVSPSGAKLCVDGGGSFTGVGINAGALNTTSTSQRYVRWQSTGADFYVGTETSVGGSFFPNSTAYSACLYNANSTPMHFYTGGTLRATIDTSGNLLVGVTSANANGGVLQLKSGITFPATQVASSDANTLDDYEEGTFTPTIVGTSTAGTATYAVQSGLYTKVGRVVTIQIYIAWSGGTGTGNLSMAGLPFTAGGTNYGVLSAYPLNIALTAGYYLGASVNLNATTIGISQLPTGGGADAAVPYDADGSLLLTGTYFV